MSVRRFLDSFNNAADGVVYALKTQRNMRVHFTAAVLVLSLGLYLRLGAADLLFLFFAITLVIAAEMINTAVEAAVDLYTQEFHPLARAAKNVAAGAVLVTALNSVAVGFFVFYPRLQQLSLKPVPQAGKTAPLFVALISIVLVLLIVLFGKTVGGKGGRGLFSGHTAAAFAGAAALVLLTGSFAASAVALIMALLVAHSRLQSGRRAFFEVAASALLGILVTLAAFRLAGC
ncbi:hypothetical membrane protein [Pelotomaculum thermopropionicum SI]|uniref:Hypothetical membrane protein n=1 Tax=Pelotomaculum thermopropionicum (strain DSM 13744 / JCM 10971 / SI) TaxID=370438 RepID=A5D3W3_PELTS|nr:hypothetical membrane protein [Pelotomaculum thermopropionicum SI]